MATSCDFCKTTFNSNGIRSKHNREKAHKKCRQCKNWFRDVAALLEHTQAKHSPAPASITWNGPSKYDGKYQEHLTNQSDPSVTCWGCDRVFDSASGLLNHLESGYCAGGINRAVVLSVIDHYDGPWKNRGQNAAKEPLLCVTCGKTCQVPSQLLRHFEGLSCEEGYIGGHGSGTDLLHKLMEGLGVSPLVSDGRLATEP